MNAVGTRMTARWRLLQPRERRLAVACAIVIALSVLVVLEDWQRRERNRLEKALPSAEFRLATMQKMADEHRQRVVDNRNGTKSIATVEALGTSLRGRNLPLTIQISGASRLVIKGHAGFDDWVDWVASAASLGWRVEQAMIQRDTATAGGLVSIEATMSSGAD